MEDRVQLPSRRQVELPRLPGDLPSDGEGASPLLRQLPSTFTDWEVGSGQPHLHANCQVSRAALRVRQLSHTPRRSRLGSNNLGVNLITSLYNILSISTIKGHSSVKRYCRFKAKDNFIWNLRVRVLHSIVKSKFTLTK